MKNTIIMIAFVLGTSIASMAQSKKLAELKVKTSAVCEMCEAKIERDMSFEKGVKSADLDLETKIVTVKYDPKKTNEAAVRTAITMVGYDADDLMADAKAYEKLPGCCKKDVKPHHDMKH